MSADNEPGPSGPLRTVGPDFLPDLPPLEGTISRLANPVDIYLAGKSPHTQRMTRSHMNRVAKLFGYPDYLSAPWGSLRYQHVQQLVGYLTTAGFAPNTINAVIAAVRGVAVAAFNMYQLDADDLTRIKGVRMVRGSRLPAGRVVPMGEISNLVGTCVRDKSPAGARDAAIIGFLYIGGLRRAEVAKARREQLSLKDRTLRIIGKGNKERKAFLDAGTVAALEDWLTVRGSLDGPLFLRILKNGKLVHTGLTDQAIYDVVRRRWKQAGIPPVSPHDFRRTFISTLLSQGVDVFTVQRMAGHANPQTTGRYDLRPEEEARAAAAFLHLPYSRQL